MSISLTQIVKQLETKTVEIKGTSVQLKAISAAEKLAVDRQYPAPIAPLGPDPNQGSLSLAPNYRDPQYLQSQQRRTSVVRCVYIAISADISRADGSRWTVDQTQVWLDELADEMLAGFTDYELTRLFKIVDDLDAGTIREGELIGGADRTGF